MNLRQKLKYFVFNHVPFLRGAFPYFGTQVYFPRRSLTFKLACEQGIFESANMRILTGLARPDSIYFDVGTNIGLMSIPVLCYCPKTTVISIEASPNVIPYLMRTVQGSRFGARWSVIPEAAGEAIGEAEFTLSAPEHSAFDGFQPTSRVPATGAAKVKVTTLDAEWEKLGRPDVSIIKCDVEGADALVLKGAKTCLKARRPFVLIEWYADNLAAFGFSHGLLLEIANELDYQLYAVPSFARVESDQELKLQMLVTESFLLAPES